MKAKLRRKIRNQSRLDSSSKDPRQPKKPQSPPPLRRHRAEDTVDVARKESAEAAAEATAVREAKAVAKTEEEAKDAENDEAVVSEEAVAAKGAVNTAERVAEKAVENEESVVSAEADVVVDEVVAAEAVIARTLSIRPCTDLRRKEVRVAPRKARIQIINARTSRPAWLAIVAIKETATQTIHTIDAPALAPTAENAREDTDAEAALASTTRKKRARTRRHLQRKALEAKSSDDAGLRVQQR